MVGVAIRFLSALLGSLAAFFIAAHGLHAGGYISAHSIERVDEFFRLLIAPLTSIEKTAGKTLLVLAAALVAQGLAILALFHRWDRPPRKMEVPIHQANFEIPERLRAAHGLDDDEDFDTDEEPAAPENTLPHMRIAVDHDRGPSARAIEAARRLAGRHG